MLARPRLLSALLAAPSPLMRDLFSVLLFPRFSVSGFQTACRFITTIESIVVVVSASWCYTRAILTRMRILDAAVSADQSVIAIATAIRSVIHATVSADQAVIAVVSAIRQVVRIGPGHVVVKSAVRTVISVRVIGAIWAVMRVGAWMIARVAWSPRMVAVVMRVVPCSVVDIGVVVKDDGPAASTTPAASPIHVPCVPAPAKTTRPATSAIGGAN